MAKNNIIRTQKIISFFTLLMLLILGGKTSAQDSKIEFTAHLFDYPSGQLYCEVFGEGEPLLLINGGPGMNSRGFRFIASEISKRNQRKVIIYDQRGTGKSSLREVSESTVHIDSMVYDMEFLRKRLNIETWAVMGHSFGGMLASYYATKHSDKLESIILSSSGGVDLSLFDSENLDVLGALTEQQRDSLHYWSQIYSSGDTSYTTRYWRGYYLAPAYLYKMDHRATVADRLTQGNPQLNQMVFRSMRAIDFDCKPGLKKLNVPVLIIQGKNDILNPKIAEETYNILPNSELYFLGRCAHYGWLDRPDIFYPLIHEFLEKCNQKIASYSKPE